MATASVATRTIPANDQPGLEHLLLTAEDFTDPARAAAAADNALEPITQGIEAIGELLWRAADGGFGLPNKTLHGLGVLLVHLAQFSEHVGFLESNARFNAAERALDASERANVRAA
ncbi:MAG TPA: hypothetical protein VKM35_11495 [Arenimonas sp.]|uniref:hypothetical protein n=1 Tax=Arenimonas sp. TaxID=1872635 RepID=UPI002C696123|nr:hypothetical protein [Arenimonas sp.]HMB57816.1 hypothetical protein [Arenimonas sp.]